jgi:ATP-binding cassette, subfamily C, bacterial CydC
MTATHAALTRVAALARPHRRRLALSVALGITAIGAGVGLLATSGYLVSKAALHPAILSLTVAIVGVRFFGVTRALARYLERLVSHDVAFRVLADIRVRFYERLVPLAPSGLERRAGGDLLSRFVADVDSLQHLYLRALAPPAVAVGVSVGAVAVAWWLHPAAALVLAAGLLVGGLVVPLVSALAGRATGRRQAPARADLTGEMVELLDGAAEIVVYGEQDARVARVEHADGRLVSLARRDAVLGGLTGGLSVLLSGVTVALVICVSVPAVRDGTLDGVVLAALALLTLGAFEAVVALPAAAQHLGQAAKAAARLEELADVEPPASEPALPRAAPAGTHLKLEGARARYRDDGPWVLDGVDLELSLGRRVALVGASGSGKTTIAHALVRFRDLDGGRALLDGHNLREYSQADVRAVVCLAGQESHLFASTIRENIRLARPSASDAEIAAALQRAGAWEWVCSLPDGLDTDVGQDGARVSGGQRQRIALARALLSEARILVLDEPTAHLDEESASAFVADLFASAGDLGLLMITHRVAELEDFDEIVVLEHARVAQRGTHAQLARRPGLYRELLASQPVAATRPSQ